MRISKHQFVVTLPGLSRAILLTALAGLLAACQAAPPAAPPPAAKLPPPQRLAQPTSEPDDSPVHSLVLLLNRPRALDLTRVVAAVNGAFLLHLGPDGDEPGGRNFVRGERPSFQVVVDGFALVVHELPKPYFDDRQNLARIAGDPKVRDALLYHRGWIAINIISVPADATLSEAHRQAGMLAVQLAQDNCLAVYASLTDGIAPWSESLAQSLASDDPLAALQRPLQPQVRMLASDDPRLALAGDEARRHWQQFADAFPGRKANQQFAVRAPFREGGICEFMWIEVQTIDGQTIRGTLDNQPVHLKKVQLGDAVVVTVPEIIDWAIFDENGWRGGYTLQALPAMTQPAEQ